MATKIRIVLVEDDGTQHEVAVIDRAVRSGWNGKDVKFENGHHSNPTIVITPVSLAELVADKVFDIHERELNPLKV